MGATSLALVSWRLRGLDWTLIAALVLLIFDVAFYFSAVAPAMEHATQLRQEATLLRESGDQQPGLGPRDPRAELTAFSAALAQRQSVPDLLHRLHQSAARNGVTIEQADYRPLPDPDGRLVRYQLQLPAKGTYPAVRRFLAQAANELPGLALDGVAFQRHQSADELVDAQIKFTLFVATGAAASIAQ
jgi:hypothetical protein